MLVLKALKRKKSDTAHIGANVSPIPDSSFLRDGLIVSDIIYNPKETLLLKLAREKGLPCFNGSYMLLYQGAEAFKLWTGQQMPISLIKAEFFAS